MIKIKNKTLVVFGFFNVLFLACALLLIIVPTIGRQKINDGPVIGSVAEVLLLDECPLTAATVNGVLMLLTFIISLPGMLLRKNRSLLTIHTYLIIFNAAFTLGVGLAIWFSTLQTQANLAPIWNNQTSFVQSMLQFKFQCCGYKDSSVFVADTRICTSAAVAAARGPCVGPFSVFANKFLDMIFTSMFGFCAVDGLLLLSGLCVLKDRAEKARYELIDEKINHPNYTYARL